MISFTLALLKNINVKSISANVSTLAHCLDEEKAHKTYNIYLLHKRSKQDTERMLPNIFLNHQKL